MSRCICTEQVVYSVELRPALAVSAVEGRLLDMTEVNTRRLLIGLAVGVLVLSLPDPSMAAPKLEINISMPTNRSAVVERPFVSGTVTDPKAPVWVVVHPMEAGEYWVQPAVSVQRDGSWSVQIYIGQPGSADVGKRFEIRAVAKPKARLHGGSVRSGWPPAEAISDVVEVERLASAQPTKLEMRVIPKHQNRASRHSAFRDWELGWRSTSFR